MRIIRRHFSSCELARLSELKGDRWEYAAGVDLDSRGRCTWPIYLCSENKTIGVFSDYTNDDFGGYVEEFNALALTDPDGKLARAVRDGHVDVHYSGQVIREVLLVRTMITLTSRDTHQFTLSSDAAVVLAFDVGFSAIAKISDLTSLLGYSTGKSVDDLKIPDLSGEWLGEPQLGFESSETREIVPISNGRYDRTE